MQVTQLKNGWLVAPDVKITHVDDQTATFAGGYGGWVTEGAFLVGGGGYWLANGSDDLQMAYGGLVLEWLARHGQADRLRRTHAHRRGHGDPRPELHGRVRARWRRSSLGGSPVRFGHRDRHGRRTTGSIPGDLTDRSFRVSENFFVAEPQANVLLTAHATGCASTPASATAWSAARRCSRIVSNGVSGTIAVQFGGF